MSNYDIEEMLTSAYGRKPTDVDYNSIALMFHVKQLTRIVKGIFEIECPKEWDIDYMKQYIIERGYIGIFDTTVGVVPQRCTLNGVNMFDRPTLANYSNAYFSGEGSIGSDCAIVALGGVDNVHYNGLNDIIVAYAQRLANCDASMSVNLMNTRVASVFECADSSQEKSAKAFYDELSSGRPAVFRRKAKDALSGADDGFTWHLNDVKASFVAKDICELKRDIMNEFLTIFCINNANIAKRERLNVDEVNANNSELIANMAEISRNLKLSVERVHEVFPALKFNIKLPFYEAQIAGESSTVERKEESEVEQ